MHRFVSGRSVAVLVAPILFSMIVFYHLKKKKKTAEKESTEGASAHSSFLPIPTGGSSHQFDVFLSFRGPDTRKGFTDYLYRSLVSAGTIPVSVFRDDNSLEIGEDFNSEILDAITRSKISILIISENYASSKWCLRELVPIMDCKNNMSHVVLPIFYKVDPSDVRFLKGKFGKAFLQREKRFNKEDIQEGRRALTEVSYLNGWESEKFANGHEGKLVEEVIKTVLSKLRHDFQLDVPKHLVGVDDHVNRIRNCIDTNANQAQMIGIYGMGGIGKTTLAKFIYNELSNDFVYRSFLPDVRETAHRNGIPYLQNLLIKEIQPNEHQVCKVDDGIKLIESRFKGKKVLILLDDVDHQDQLNALARERDWFMTGSIIIVTTRYKDVLDRSEFEVDCKYELRELGEVHSLLLFKRHAFRMGQCPKDFEGISRGILSTIGGLPLAIQVVGSSLYETTDRKVWQEMLKKLRNGQNRDIQNTLKISYEALEPENKEIFLDIACFFIGKDSKYAMHMWEDCDFYPHQGIEKLKLRCLVRIGNDGDFRMHDQLRDLGRSIFCQGQPIERCLKLWIDEETSREIMEFEYSEMMDAMAYYEEHSPQTYTSEQFKELPSSRFLQLYRKALSGDFNELFSELRWLRWFYTESDPSSAAINLHLPKLVVLELSHNELTEDWGGWSLIMAAKRLKVLDLAFSKYLRCTPDLSAFTELEILILHGCCELEQVHPSIGNVKRLISLDLSGCLSLKVLPEGVGELQELKELFLDGTEITKIPMSICSLRKLEKLSASRCLSLVEIPLSIGNIYSLQHLNLSYCGSLRGIPDSIGNLSSLQHLNLSCCHLLREIPSSIGNLSSLQHLDLSLCVSLREIPISIGDLQNLQHLNISCLRIEELPSAIGRLKKLQRLFLDSCIGLKGEIPREIGELSSLEILYITRAQMSYLPESIRNLSSLRGLYLQYCEELQSLQGLPSNLTSLQVNSNFTMVSELSYQTPLYECNQLEYIPELPSAPLKLCVDSCPKLILPKLDEFKYLEELSLAKYNSTERMDLSQLNRLKKLAVVDCNNLVEIHGHNNLEFLEEIRIFSCRSIERLILPELVRLKLLKASSCDNLVEIRGLDKAELLETLDISDCWSMERLPDLTCFATLEKLDINHCCSLLSIESLERFLSCRSIYIEDCQSLEKLPNLSKFENLENFTLINSFSVTEILGVEESRSLKQIEIIGCEAIETLPDLSGCEKLQSLVLRNCKKLTQLRGLETLDLRHLYISGCDSLETQLELPGIRFPCNCDTCRNGLVSRRIILR